MKAARKTAKKDSYHLLVRKLPLRPLKSNREYEAALEMARSLMLRDERSLDAGESDYLDVLSTLIERYEDSNHAVPDVSGLDALTHLMQEHGMSINDLGAVIGHQPTASQIASGKREMSKAVIGKLAHHFGVSPSTFFDATSRRIAG